MISNKKIIMFPYYKKILGIVKVKDDWEDKGEWKKRELTSLYTIYYVYKKCKICERALRVGKNTDANGEVFYYCPNCLTKYDIEK